MTSDLARPRALVTGASGFVGRALTSTLKQRGWDVTQAVRRQVMDFGEVSVGDIGASTDWRAALHECDVVVHLAARVHVMVEKAADPLGEFRCVNVDGAFNLAQQATRAGVQRLVFVSTVKVNGEATYGAPFRESDPPQPQDPYGISKWEAEQALWRIADQTGLEVVVVRPPLVYGPGVGGNFMRLLRWVKSGMPLPLAAVCNRRSLVYVGNLADALVACVEKPEAAGKTYLVSDDEVLSTSELIGRLASAMGRPARLWPCPPVLLSLGGRLLGKGAEVERLIGSLEVDSGAIRRDLHWKPPFGVWQGLEETAAWFTGAKGNA